MSVVRLDTDTLSLLEQGLLIVLQNVNNHPLADIAVYAISILEQMQGFQAALTRARNHQQIARSYDMLVTRLLPLWTRFAVLRFPEPAILRFEHLRSLLKTG